MEDQRVIRPTLCETLRVRKFRLLIVLKDAAESASVLIRAEINSII